MGFRCTCSTARLTIAIKATAPYSPESPPKMRSCHMGLASASFHLVIRRARHPVERHPSVHVGSARFREPFRRFVRVVRSSWCFVSLHSTCSSLRSVRRKFFLPASFFFFPPFLGSFVPSVPSPSWQSEFHELSERSHGVARSRTRTSSSSNEEFLRPTRVTS